MARSVLLIPCVFASLASAQLACRTPYRPPDATGAGRTEQQPSALVSVKDFGAKGDGVTDDCGSIQNAITTLSAAGGGTLSFPPGTYLFKCPIHGPQGNLLDCKSNVTFQGAGIDATVWKLANNTYVTPNSSFAWYSCLDNAVYADSGTYVNNAFRDMTFDVNGQNNPFTRTDGARWTLFFGDMSNVEVQRVRFTNLDTGNAIWVGIGGHGLTTNRRVGTKNLVVRDCSFENPTANNNVPNGTNDFSGIVSLADDTVIQSNSFTNTTLRGRMFATAVEIHGNNSSVTGNRISGYRQLAYVAAETGINPLLQNVVVSANTGDVNIALLTLWSDTVNGTVTGVEREIRGAFISDNNISVAPTHIGAPGQAAEDGPDALDLQSWAVGTLGPNGWGQINQITIQHNRFTFVPPPKWVGRGRTYSIGQLVTGIGAERGTDRVFSTSVTCASPRTTGTCTSLGSAGPRGNAADLADPGGGTCHWQYLFGFDIVNGAVMNSQDVAEWTVTDNYLEGWNYGVYSTCSKGATATAIAGLSAGQCQKVKQRYRANRCAECAVPTNPSGATANDVIFYFDNTTVGGAAVSGPISGLIVEDNRFVNATAQARPIYVDAAATGSVNYSLTGNRAMNFTPGTRLTTVNTVPSKGGMTADR